MILDTAMVTIDTPKKMASNMDVHGSVSTCLAIMSGYWSPMFRYVLKDRRSVDDDGHQGAVDGVQKYDIPKNHRSAAGKIHSLQMTICY